MVIINNKLPDWEGEFDSLVQKMRDAFFKQRINEFLQFHHQVNVLFSKRLQWIIDSKPVPHQVVDYNLNVDPNLMKKIEAFNENMSKLTEDTDDEGKIKTRKDLQGKAY